MIRGRLPAGFPKSVCGGAEHAAGCGVEGAVVFDHAVDAFYWVASGVVGVPGPCSIRCSLSTATARRNQSRSVFGSPPQPLFAEEIAEYHRGAFVERVKWEIPPHYVMDL